MPRIDFEAIKRTADLVAVIQSHGVELTREGKDWVGLCPFHDDKKPSLRVTPGKGLWRCMSCDATGNVIQFVAKKENLSDKEAAVRLLASVPGVQTAAQLVKKTEPPRVIVPPQVAADLLHRVAGFYQRAFFKDRAGLDYLARRNLTDAAMLESFRIGYCNGTLKSALPQSPEILAQLQALGVLNAEGNEVFYGRVTVPILDGNGVVVGLYGRKVEGQGARLPADAAPHLYLAGGHRAAFNANAAKHAERLILVESILDALSVWQSGERAAIPLYGAKGWTEHHDALVGTTQAREIILALDNDAAGRTATAQLRAHLLPLAPKVAVRVLAWPEGCKDANAFFCGAAGPAPVDTVAAGGAPLSPGPDFAALLANAEPKPPAPASPLPTESTAGEEKIESRPHGFALVWPQRRYEVMALARTSATRLKATVQALGSEPGRFHVETLDLYNAKARRIFASEAARLFRLPVAMTEADLAKILLAAEQHVAHAAAQSAAVLVSEPDKAEAWKLGRAADLVGEIHRDLDKLGIVGERTNRLLLYLGLTSRRMADPLAVQVLSGSGAGKSHLQDAVLSLCPEEDLIKLTSLSNQALFYKGEDSLRHKCLAVEEVAGAAGARYALRNLISAKKLVIETTVKNPLTGKMETQQNTVHGPTAVFETTTDPHSDPETKSRFIITSIDESAEQTRAIVAAQRQRHTLDGLRARHRRGEVYRRHHAFQRLLRTIAIANPYEPLLGYGDDRLVFRRDNPKYLHLILAVTFLHQMQRPVKGDAEIGDYIETTLADIAIANELALELFGSGVEELSRPSRELLERTADYVAAKAARTKTPGERVEFARRELREALGWGEYQLRVHLRELVALEYVVPLGGRHGALFTYRLAWSPEQGERFVPGLKSVEQLRRAAELLGLPGSTSLEQNELRSGKASLRAPKSHFEGTSLATMNEVAARSASSLPAVYRKAAATSFASAEGTLPINGKHA